MADLKIVDSETEEKDTARWESIRHTPLLHQCDVITVAVEGAEHQIQLADEVLVADPGVGEIGALTLKLRTADVTLVSAAVQIMGLLSEVAAERCQGLLNQLDTENDRVEKELTEEDKEKLSDALVKVQEARVQRMFGGYDDKNFSGFDVGNYLPTEQDTTDEG